MDYFMHVGAKVKFDSSKGIGRVVRDHARTYLIEGGIYTVESESIGMFYTITLEEVPDHSFAVEMFEVVEPAPHILNPPPSPMTNKELVSLLIERLLDVEVACLEGKNHEEIISIVRNTIKEVENVKKEMPL